MSLIIDASLTLTWYPEADHHIWTRVLRFSDQFGLTIYDACYLELSERHNLPLATLDRALRAASQKLGIQILGM